MWKAASFRLPLEPGHGDAKAPRELPQPDEVRCLSHAPNCAGGAANRLLAACDYLAIGWLLADMRPKQRIGTRCRLLDHRAMCGMAPERVINPEAVAA